LGSGHEGRDFTAVSDYPRRIICLTEETTETLYLLGEQDRIVGVSGYTVRPPEARKKPKVSAFITANFEKILDLQPDLIFAFSDLQADLVRELIKRGANVFTFNQRSVAEILAMILIVGRIVGAEERAKKLIDEMQAEMDLIRESASRFPRRPLVFFEEWNEPLISGIRWVEELIEIAGGSSLYPELRERKNAPDRILNPLDVASRMPEVDIASWCGRLVQKKLILGRAGWQQVPAVLGGHVYEVKSSYILQPGPAALTEGLRQLHLILAHVAGMAVEKSLMPKEKIDRDLAIALQDASI
jgi:iron complex transport system substrate-binding protein